ncbi:MAG: translation initiation factor IF-3 [Candidatus Dormibacteraeota bacterium]|uniref:Translation initiation factor IF-3 n=1 Tax=Candidatus Amunia macphersoniae TaxID=3127014 RepID=A0A934KM46_9BACT|nr:translation initiation factor IF-3 [Candidatus Dormibacteraeota bacterium]
MNEQIRIPQVRLFDDTTDEALGIVPVEQARQLAVDRGLDLVEVAPLAQPPVCRLMDYGRFKFEALKREKDSRRDHNVVQLKEQKLRPKISDNDFRTKLNKVKQFLGEGDKVKLTIMFRGREMVHQEYGRKLLDRMTEELSDLAIIERSPLVEGRNMIMILSPTTKKHARGDRPHEERAAETQPGNGSAAPAPASPSAPASEPVTATTDAPEPAQEPRTSEATVPAPTADTVSSPAAATGSATAGKAAPAARKPAAAGATAKPTTKKTADSRGKENAQDSNS